MDSSTDNDNDDNDRDNRSTCRPRRYYKKYGMGLPITLMFLAHLFFHLVAFSCDSFQGDRLFSFLQDDDWTGTPISDGYEGPGSGQYINYRRHLAKGNKAKANGLSYGYLGVKSDGSCTSWDSDTKDGSLKAGMAIGVLGSLLGWLFIAVVVLFAVLDLKDNKPDAPTRSWFNNSNTVMTLGSVMGPLMAILSGCLYVALSFSECRDPEVRCYPTAKGHLIGPTCALWLVASICLYYILRGHNTKDSGGHNDHPENNNNENDNVDGSDSASRTSQSPQTMEERIVERTGISVLRRVSSRRLLGASLFVTWIFWNVCVFDCSAMRALEQNQDYKDGLDFGLFSRADYDKDGDRYACIAYPPDMPIDVALNAGRAFGVFGFIFHTLASLLALSLELCVSWHNELAWNTVRGLLVASTVCSLFVFVALANEDCTDDNGLHCAPGPSGIVGIFNILFLVGVVGLSFITPAPKETFFVVKRRHKLAVKADAAEEGPESLPRKGDFVEEASSGSTHLEEMPIGNGEIIVKRPPKDAIVKETKNRTQLEELPSLIATKKAQQVPPAPPVATTVNQKHGVQTYEVQYRKYKGVMSLQSTGVVFQETPGTDVDVECASAVRYQIHWYKVRRVVLNTSHTKLRIEGTAEVCHINDGVPEQFAAFLIVDRERAEELRDDINKRGSHARRRGLVPDVWIKP